MKKIIAIAALLVMSVTAVNAQIKFGIKGGANITKMSLSKDVVNSDNRCGFYFGPTLKASLPVVGLGLDISALYNQRQSKVSESTSTDSYSENVTHKSISIPLNVRYQLFGAGDAAGLFVYTGPQVDFTVGSKNVLDGIDSKFKDSDFSWNIGLGVMLLNHLQINANYNIGLTKTSEIQNQSALKSAGEIISSKEHSWQIGLAYYF